MRKKRNKRKRKKKRNKKREKKKPLTSSPTEMLTSVTLVFAPKIHDQAGGLGEEIRQEAGGVRRREGMVWKSYLARMTNGAEREAGVALPPCRPRECEKPRVPS